MSNPSETSKCKRIIQIGDCTGMSEYCPDIGLSREVSHKDCLGCAKKT